MRCVLPQDGCRWLRLLLKWNGIPFNNGLLHNLNLASINNLNAEGLACYGVEVSSCLEVLYVLLTRSVCSSFLSFHHRNADRKK